MRTSETANEPRARAAVQPVQDGTLVGRDEPRGSVPARDVRAASGGRKAHAVYAGIAAVVATVGLINAFSVNYDLTRVGRAHKLWEPFVWEATSAILLIALLALPRRRRTGGGHRPRPASRRLGRGGLGLGVLGRPCHRNGPAAHAVYATLGASYFFHWSVGELVYELRNDAFAFLLIAVMFR
jgi:hypothetical protein